MGDTHGGDDHHKSVFINPLVSLGKIYDIITAQPSLLPMPPPKM